MAGMGPSRLRKYQRCRRYSCKDSYLVKKLAQFRAAFMYVGVISPNVLPSTSATVRRAIHTDFLMACSSLATKMVDAESM